MIAHYAFSYEVAKSSFSEPESETMTYSFATNDTAARSSWISLTENTTHIIFTGTPSNTQFGNFNVSIIVDDGHDDVDDLYCYVQF